MSQHQVQCYHPVSSCSMEICFCWHKWRSSVCTNTTRVHCGQDSQYCIGQLNNTLNRLHCLNCTACTAVADRRMSLNLGRSRSRHTVTDIPHQNCCCLACIALHVSHCSALQRRFTVHKARIYLSYGRRGFIATADRQICKLLSAAVTQFKKSTIFHF